MHRIQHLQHPRRLPIDRLLDGEKVDKIGMQLFAGLVDRSQRLAHRCLRGLQQIGGTGMLEPVIHRRLLPLPVRFQLRHLSRRLLKLRMPPLNNIVFPPGQLVVNGRPVLLLPAQRLK